MAESLAFRREMRNFAGEKRFLNKRKQQAQQEEYEKDNVFRPFSRPKMQLF